MHYLSVFGLKFQKTIARFCAKGNLSKFGTKNAWHDYFWAKIWVRIWVHFIRYSLVALIAPFLSFHMLVQQEYDSFSQHVLVLSSFDEYFHLDDLQSWTKYLEQNRTTKVWYLLLHVSWLLLPKFNSWKGDWALGCVLTQIWDFSIIFLFPKILSLTLS